MVIMAPHAYHGKEKETRGLIFSWLSWLTVLLVGAWARGRVRTTTTTTAELPNMAAILQKTDTTLVYRVLL